MIYFNKKIVYLNKDPIVLFKVDNFFDYNFYLDIKKLFTQINFEELSLTTNFGKKSIQASQSSFDKETQQRIFSQLNKVLYDKQFFYFFVKEFFFKNLFTQKSILKKIRYSRYPVIDDKKKSLLDFLYSKISIEYNFSYIKNKGSILPHVDAQRKYLSLMLYFPDDDEKDIEYGTTFWKSNIPNFSNTHIQDIAKINDFKLKSKPLLKSQFVPNCLYGFLRNNFSWHTVEPLNVSSRYIRKSLNINFLYNN
jgi:hypothetical protein